MGVLGIAPRTDLPIRISAFPLVSNGIRVDVRALVEPIVAQPSRHRVVPGPKVSVWVLAFWGVLMCALLIGVFILNASFRI